MPRKLRLLNITPEGYVVGTGVTQPQNNVLVRHEVAVAILTGLADDPKLLKDASGEPKAGDLLALALRDAANGARRLLAGVAWRLGCCSWNREWRATEHNATVFQTQSE